MIDGYVVAVRLDEVRPGTTKRVVIDGNPVLLANVDGTVYAVDDMCTHEDSSLSLGCLRGELVDCTLHGSRFSVVTGEPVEEPATEALRTWAVCIEHGSILVQAGTG
jgi:3-phenylpropionate/trans-cinnamate dioxygenase ferredoxin component